MSTENLQQTLDRILSELHSNDPQRCISAMDELGKLNTSSPAILKQLETLAVHDSNDDVGKHASVLLNTPVYRLIRKSNNRLNSSDRQVVLREIEKWETDGLLDSTRTDILKQRYNFDSPPQPAPSKPTPVMESSKP